jgi:ribosomal protein L37AE/L43A
MEDNKYTCPTCKSNKYISIDAYFVQCTKCKHTIAPNRFWIKNDKRRDYGRVG